jgi:hypothetical protein
MKGDASDTCHFAVVTDSPSVYVDVCLAVRHFIYTASKNLRELGHSSHSFFNPMTGYFCIVRDRTPRFGRIRLRTPEQPFYVAPEDLPVDGTSQDMAVQEMLRWQQMFSPDTDPNSKMPLDEQLECDAKNPFIFVSEHPTRGFSLIHEHGSDVDSLPLNDLSRIACLEVQDLMSVSALGANAIRDGDTSIIVCQRRERVRESGTMIDCLFSTAYHRRMRTNPYTTLGSRSHQTEQEVFIDSVIRGTEGCCDGLSFDKPECFRASVWISRAHTPQDIATALITINGENWPTSNIAKCVIGMFTSESDNYTENMIDSQASVTCPDPWQSKLPLACCSPWILVQAENEAGYNDFFTTATNYAFHIAKEQDRSARCDWKADAFKAFGLPNGGWVSISKEQGTITAWVNREMRQVRVLRSDARIR